MSGSTKSPRAGSDAPDGVSGLGSGPDTGPHPDSDPVRSPRTSGSDRGTVFPLVPVLVLFLLVGVLVWAAGESPPSESVVIENPAEEPRHTDLVWRAEGGDVSTSLLRVVEPRTAVGYRIPAGATGCVRWIDDGSVRATWRVPATASEEPGTALELSLDGDSSGSACPPELVGHRIRPALGRWMIPDEPVRLHRERMIPRVLHRRAIRRVPSSRRRNDGDGSFDRGGPAFWMG